MADQVPLLSAKSNKPGGSPSYDGGYGGARVAVFVALVVLLGATLGQIYWASSYDGRYGFAYISDVAYGQLAIARDMVGGMPEQADGVEAASPLVGAASPGWVLLLVGLLRTPMLSAESGRSAEDIALVPLVLNFAVAALLILIAGHLVRREIRGWLWMFLLLTAMGVFMPLPLVIMSGMDYLLHACIMLLLVAVGIAAMESGGFALCWVVLAMIFAACGVVLRYESLWVLAALLLWGWIQGRWFRGILPLAAGAAAAVAVGVYLLGHGGECLPKPIMGHCQSLFEGKFREAYGHGRGLLVFVPSMPFVILLMGVALLAVSRAGMHSDDRQERERAGWLFVFVVAGLAHLLAGPTGQHRHEAYLVPMGAVAIGRTLAACGDGGRRICPRGNCLVAGLCMLTVVAVALPFLHMVSMSGELVRDAYVRGRMMSSFVRTYFPAGPVVTNQSGILCYETQARVLDPWWAASTGLGRGFEYAQLEHEIETAQVALVKEPGFGKELPPNWVQVGGWRRSESWWNSSGDEKQSDSSVGVYAVSAEKAEVVGMALRRAKEASRKVGLAVDYWFADSQSPPTTQSAPAAQAAVMHDVAVNRPVRATQRPACEASCHRTTGADAN